MSLQADWHPCHVNELQAHNWAKPMAEWEQFVQIGGIRWGPLDNDRSAVRLSWAAREKEALQRQAGRKKTSRLPLTEIDPSKLTTRTVVVSSLLWFSLPPLEMRDAGREISAGWWWLACGSSAAPSSRLQGQVVRGQEQKPKTYKLL